MCSGAGHYNFPSMGTMFRHLDQTNSLSFARRAMAEYCASKQCRRRLPSSALLLGSER